MDKKRIAAVVITIVLALAGTFFGGDFKASVCGVAPAPEAAK